jgi:Tol biopolymer transport system component
MTYPTILLRTLIGGVLASTILIAFGMFIGRVLPPNELALDIHRTGQRDIYLLDLPHNLDYRLTHGSGDNQIPVWSPDGSQIAYVSLYGANQTIMVMDADGHNRHPIFSSSSGYMGSLSLAWSPDSQRLAFTALLEGRQVIYIVPVMPDASGQTGVEQVTAEFNNAFSPTWSPDGAYLAFSWANIASPKIFVAPLTLLTLPLRTAAGLRQLTHTSAQDTMPSWSPDSQRIAFVSDRDSNSEIYSMKPDGSDLRRLTYSLAADIAPSWTPDSQQVTFTSNRTGDWEVYTVEAACDSDTSCQSSLVQVTHNHQQGDKLRAVWRPTP